jgi:hypothetical protein
MLFENASQFQKAKQTLLENNRDINKTAYILKKSPLFSNLSEGEIISHLMELNEGLGDTIMNFLSSSFGGDVSKLKTVLTQMKEQELKFNREEYQIWDEFYKLTADQKALDKDKNNPNYQEMSRSLQQARNALNTRMKELTKTHNEIFDALEQRVRDLTKDSNRKKKYFNAQRATDVQETRNDRYEKVKSITARSVNRAQDLEDFFNVKVSDVEKEREEAKRKAEREVEILKKTSTEAPKSETPRKRGIYDQEPEKSFHEELESIKSTPGGYYAKRRALESLEDDIFKAIMNDDKNKTSENPHGELGETSRYNINQLNLEIQKITKELEKAYSSTKSGSTTRAKTTTTK